MSNKVLNPNQKFEKYDLIAISNHMGGLGSGHYTAIALNNGRWVDFNDSMVSATKSTMPETFASREAYILYYRRREDDSVFGKIDVSGKIAAQWTVTTTNGNLMSPLKPLNSSGNGAKLSPSTNSINSSNSSTPSKRRASELMKMEVDDNE